MLCIEHKGTSDVQRAVLIEAWKAITRTYFREQVDKLTIHPGQIGLRLERNFVNLLETCLCHIQAPYPKNMQPSSHFPLFSSLKEKNRMVLRIQLANPTVQCGSSLNQLKTSLHLYTFFL